MRSAFTYTLGEFIDKLTIVSKKDLCGLPGAKEELSTMMSWLNKKGVDANLVLSIIRIAQTNMDIWHHEHAVRNAAEGSMPLSEVGRRSIMIRNTNKIRVKYKNELDIICKEGQVEEKIHHLAEDMYDKFYDKKGIKYKKLTHGEGGEE